MPKKMMAKLILLLYCNLANVARRSVATSSARKELHMPQGQAIFLGLNQTGLIAFIILLIVCLPLCWIPFLIDSCKGNAQ